MKKEVLIAIIAGVAIGLIVTFGIRTARQSIDQHSQTISPVPAEPDAIVESTHALTITSPAPHTLSTSDTIEIQGITSDNAFVSLTSASAYETVQANEIGSFRIAFPLEVGPNSITVSSYDVDGQTASAIVEVVYTTEAIVRESAPSEDNVDSSTIESEEAEANDAP